MIARIGQLAFVSLAGSHSNSQTRLRRAHFFRSIASAKKNDGRAFFRLTGAAVSGIIKNVRRGNAANAALADMRPDQLALFSVIVNIYPTLILLSLNIYTSQDL